MPEPGKLKPPYPVERCAASECRRLLSDDVGAFMFRDTTKQNTGYLLVFCEGCAADIELNGPPTLRLVAL
jgi:hypothetical protein